VCNPPITCAGVQGAVEADEESIAELTGWLTDAAVERDRILWQAAKGVLSELSRAARIRCGKRLDRSVQTVIQQFAADEVMA
jgi:hypothetical protein